MRYPPANINDQSNASDGKQKDGKKSDGNDEDKSIDEIIKEIEDEMDDME